MDLAEHHQERFEFHIPRVNIGLADEVTHAANGAFARDTIQFELQGRIWRLRRPLKKGESLLPADTAFHEAQAKGESFKIDLNSDHAILEVSTDGISLEEAGTTADDIGWLLGMAFGQRVTWSEVGVRKNHHRRILRGRSITLPAKASRFQPLSNQAGREVAIFLEQAYPVFIKDRQWWMFTLHWFALAYESTTVEVSGMIHSMLLDRISSWILDGHEFEKQIGMDLGECLSDSVRRSELSKELNDLMQRFAAKWTPARTEALVGTIKGWNNSPPYKKKIATAFGLIGLKPPPPVVTDARHTLMHTGSLPELDHDYIVNYDREVHLSIVILLLTIFGHDGMFFARDRGMLLIREFRLDEQRHEG